MFDGLPLGVMVEELGKAARADTDFVSDTQLAVLASELEQARRLLDATQCHVLARLDARGVCDERFGMTTARWLAHEGDLPAAVANERVRVAVRLATTLPETDALLSAGEIGFDHAKVMQRAAHGRVADQVQEIESALLTLRLADGGFDGWKKDVAAVLDRIDADGGHDPGPDDPPSRLSLGWGLDSRLYLDGTFDQLDGAQLEAVLNERADELFRRYTEDHHAHPEIEVPARSELLAMAFAELLGWGHSAHRKGTAVNPTADVTVVVKTAHGGRYRWGETAFGTKLSDQVMEFLGCNATFAALIVNDLGVPLDLGHTHRYANRAQRRALLVRQRGCCAFPGCSVPLAQCDVHHIEHYPAGPTDMINLIGLCRRHHRVTHRRGWSLVANPDQTFTWTTPHDDKIHSRGPPDLATA